MEQDEDVDASPELEAIIHPATGRLTLTIAPDHDEEDAARAATPATPATRKR